MKFNLIFHITTYCNYNCSYCDVIKDKRHISLKVLANILDFIKKNKDYIHKFKFFGGEPLLAWNNIKRIIDDSTKYIGGNFEIVTNTSLLNYEVGEYFKKYFKIIFFSIDSENNFNYKMINKFIKDFNLKNKIYFNLIISPNNEKQALEQFYKLYNLGFRGFNILPVYITKAWSRKTLLNLSKIMKKILDLSIYDDTLRLYGFQENLGEELKLVNNTFFINYDGKIYYSDIISTFNGKKIKDNLFLGEISEFSLKKVINYNFKKEHKYINKLTKSVYRKVDGQKQLQEIMDYFSVYLKNII